MTGGNVISNTFERHTQTALVLLLVALLLWVGSTTQTTAVSIAEMRIEIAYLKVSVERPHEHGTTIEAITDLRQRVAIIEAREHEEQ